MDSITIVLLLVVIALQLWNITKKSNIEELKVILQRTAEEQRDGVRNKSKVVQRNSSNVLKLFKPVFKKHYPKIAMN